MASPAPSKSEENAPDSLGDDADSALCATRQQDDPVAEYHSLSPLLLTNSEAGK